MTRDGGRAASDGRPLRHTPQWGIDRTRGFKHVLPDGSYVSGRPSDQELEELIGYIFLDKDLLRVALTHPSAVVNPEDKLVMSNGRLEFLGDAVLGLVVGEMLYERDPPLDEGKMTEARKSFVANQRVREIAALLDLDRWLDLGGPELTDGGRGKPKRGGDAFEALIGAIHRDAGPAHASQVVRRIFERYPVPETAAGTPNLTE